MKRWKVAWLVTMLVVLVWGFFSLLKEGTVSPMEWRMPLPVPTAKEEKVRIVVMADIHSDIDQLRTMLGKVKESGVEFVVVAGDLTINGKSSELSKVKEVLDESGLKYAVVPGNHEYSIKNFVEIFGKNYQSLRFGRIKLILVDNSYWQGLGEGQKKWLETEVTDCRVFICVAVMHKPLNNLLSTHIMGENNEKVTAEANWLRELLISSGVKQIEAGHLHYSSSYELEGIRTDIVGAISRERNNQTPRYTELMIGKDLIERKVIEEENDIRD